MDIRKFFGGKPSACSNAKATEKKPTKVANKSKTSRKTTKADVKTGTSNSVSKCKIVSKENVCNKETGSRLSRKQNNEDVTNNNGDGNESGGSLPEQAVNKKESRTRTNGKNTAVGKSSKEAKKNPAKCQSVLLDKETTVIISDESDEEVRKKPIKKSKSRKDLSDEETQMKPAKRSASKRNMSDGSNEEVQKRPKKKSKATKDLSDGSDEEVEKRSKKKSKAMVDLSDRSDEEVQKRSKKKSRSMRDLSDGSDEEVQRRAKKKPNSRKGGVIFDSDSEEEGPLPASHKKTPRRRRRKEVTVVLDSGDEFEPIKEAFAKMTPKIKSPRKPQISPPKQKLVSVLDFFGVAAVRQDERKTVAAKRKSETNLADKTVENHSDSDFEKTLEQLDGSRKKIKLDSGESADTAPASVPSSLSSKLASQAKHFVEETPEKSSSQRVSRCATVDLMSSPIKSSVTSDWKVTPSKVTPSKASPVKSRTTPVKSTPTRSMSTRSTPSKKTPPCGTNSPGKAVAMKSSEAHKTSPQEASPAVKTPNRGASYRSYLHREGPRALGSKEIPQGGENCLEGLTFVITGVLESLERDEAQSLVEKYGGKVTKSLSKKTSYLVAGRDAGESKIAKAESLKTPQIDEDALLELIAKRPGKKSKYEIAAEKESKAKPEKKTDLNRTPSVKSERSRSETMSQMTKERPSTSDRVGDLKVERPVMSKRETSTESLLWVDKYKPQSLKHVIGQLGDKSNARKLLNWLTNWHKNLGAGKKPVFNRFNDDGSGYRAALLSGPPGIGKTTTAQLVCKETGFSFVELNASDTRSKKSLQHEVAATLDNTTLTDFYGKTAKSSKTQTNKDCILMDEVDGMAGNEDRGGIQELIQLIKHTKMPIICLCNDRNHIKMRSLSNYTFDLRFQRPRVEQIKAAMMSIAYKEGLKIPPPAMNEIIIASNHDIRQVIHNLSMWTSSDKACSYEQLKSDAKKAKKDIKLGPFDVCRKVFVGGEETSHMTLNDKSDLFFHDYSFGPLFVQENYIHVTPFAARGNACKHLELLSAAADSISDGDLVDKRIRSAQNWNLLPLQAMYASVLPGEIMRGSLGQMVQFPSWLGKNSSRTKHNRQTHELTAHMRLRVLTDKNGLNLDYLPHLRRALTEPLIRVGQDGVTRVVSLLDDYDLMREDFESIIEVTQWPNMKDPMKEVIESKVKAAFTRTYNKEVHLTPYAITSGAKKGKRKGGGGEGDLGEEGEEEAVVSEESDQEDVLTDGMIKQKKKPRKTSQTKAPSDTKKGKGKGPGKGKGKK